MTCRWGFHSLSSLFLDSAQPCLSLEQLSFLSCLRRFPLYFSCGVISWSFRSEAPSRVENAQQAGYTTNRVLYPRTSMCFMCYTFTTFEIFKCQVLKVVNVLCCILTAVNIIYLINCWKNCIINFDVLFS